MGGEDEKPEEKEAEEEEEEGGKKKGLAEEKWCEVGEGLDESREKGRRMVD